MSPNDPYSQHVVTAVIVAHDGSAWLPQVADAVLAQTRPVQRVVAVDTGSRDRSGAILASKFGAACVFGMDRSTSYGAAVARALQHRSARTPVQAAPGYAADGAEWIWLLHDDSEPAPDALEQLLRGAAEVGAAAVLGPKLRDWSNRDVVVEAGITIDTAGRRVTGIDPREVDQGQHDGDRDALAVSSAGMLVRRDVWQQVGGFDAGMGLFMEDIDFCWRVHAAGHRVRVVTDAVAYHARAATKRRRSVSVGRRPHMLDRRNSLLTLLGNLPARPMLKAAGGNFVLSLLRIAFFLLAKRLLAALDEAAALIAVFGHPARLFSMRHRRSAGRRAAYARVRADLPSGRTFRRLAEFASSMLAKSSPADVAGAHHASIDPTEDDSILIDDGIVRRVLTSPGVLTFVALAVVALVAGRSLLGQQGPLGGGSLVPAWGGVSDIWTTALQAFHPSGIGSPAQVPPYLIVIAILGTLLGGKPWLAIDVILLGAVPLAGLSALLAVRRVTTSRPVRAWAAASYALLPVGMGVVAAGRFGTAVVFVLLPLIGLQAARIFTEPRRQARRAAWATGVLVTVGAAFVPLLWVLALVAAALAALALRQRRSGSLVNLAIVALTPPILTLPWMVGVLSHPAALLLEAGLQPGTASAGLPARSLMLLSPGGPGVPPYWMTAGIVVAALAALVAGRRRKLIMAGWCTAMAGMLVEIALGRVTVIPPDGGSPVALWAGLPISITALGLLLAATAGTTSLGRILAGRRSLRVLDSPRGMAAAGMIVIACASPVLLAGWWTSKGVHGPVHPVSASVAPQLVGQGGQNSAQVRTLVLRSEQGHLAYAVLRGTNPGLADADLRAPAAADAALGQAVAALVAPGGGAAVDQSKLLANFDIGYVLLESPVDQQLAARLNNVAGMRPYSTTSSHDLWVLDTLPSRVAVMQPDGKFVPISAGPLDVSGAVVPTAGGTLVLAEPAGGWHASVNGQALTAVPSPDGAWAQAFRLPPGGGRLEVGYSSLGYQALMVIEALALLVVIALALPGIRAVEAEPAEHSTPAPAPEDTGDMAAVGGRRRRPAHAAEAAPDREGDAAVPAVPVRAEVERTVAASTSHAAGRVAATGARSRSEDPGLAAAGTGRAMRRLTSRGRTDGDTPSQSRASDPVESDGRGPARGRGKLSRSARRDAEQTVSRRATAAVDRAVRRSPRAAGAQAPWPYLDGADLDSRTGRPSGAWPYAADDDGRGGPAKGADLPRGAVADPASGRAEQSRSSIDRDSQIGRGFGPPGDRSASGEWPQSGRPGSASRGRSPSGEWPSAGQSGLTERSQPGQADARSPRGRSASGEWPQPGRPGDTSRGRAPSGEWPQQGRGDAGSPRGRSASGEWPQPGPGSHRRERSASGEWPQRGRSASGGRPGSGPVDRGGPPRPYPAEPTDDRAGGAAPQHGRGSVWGRPRRRNDSESRGPARGRDSGYPPDRQDANEDPEAPNARSGWSGLPGPGSHSTDRDVDDRGSRRRDGRDGYESSRGDDGRRARHADDEGDDW